MKPEPLKTGSIAARIAAGVAPLLFLLAGAALAGPPLICHRIEIGKAVSLPWNGPDWNLTGSDSYDTRNLVRDTLELLAPETPVLVRMETLRRATLYARKDPLAAKQLLTRLHARAAAEPAGKADALAWFDEGYLVESFKQWIGQSWMRVSPNEQNPAAGIDGYALVQKAIVLRGSDPQMEFAAALISLSGSAEALRLHAEKAIAGAGSDSLLAQNLRARFVLSQNRTIQEMLTRTTVAESRP